MKKFLLLTTWINRDGGCYSHWYLHTERGSAEVQKDQFLADSAQSSTKLQDWTILKVKEVLSS
jgi:hypothetical protein